MPLIDAIKTVLRASGRPGLVKTGSTMFKSVPGTDTSLIDSTSSNDSQQELA